MIACMKNFYSDFLSRVKEVRTGLKRPLTFTEKIILSHQYEYRPVLDAKRGEDYVDLRPDRVAMQDATAQMAMLQFMNAGKREVAVPATIHCDHLIKARNGSAEDLQGALKQNEEVYQFLQTVAAKYGIGFWKPGAGIIHQIVLENYAFPGGMMVGTDSHTPNAGGLGMMAVGVGGADAVDVLTGEPWQLKMPKIYGVRLVGKLGAWASPKDVILNLLGRLTVKGGTNAVFEYFGSGVESISATGRATICNMGAELGATCSLFAYDDNTRQYLIETGRKEWADLADQAKDELKADSEVLLNPDLYYDKVIEIDLSSIEPHLNGPFTPDAATTLTGMKDRLRAGEFPAKVDAVLIGSCTNSSYEDLSMAASVARNAIGKHLKAKSQLIVCPGSEQVKQTAERDGLLDELRAVGAVIMTNACGPCIGQWDREGADKALPNTIVTTFNRNFKRRADGNPNTYAFISSPVIAVALAIAGRLDFDPSADTVTNSLGEDVRLDIPQGNVFPRQGFKFEKGGFIAPDQGNRDVDVKISPDSQRIQRLQPFDPWDGKELENMKLLIKVKGKCTTDHISMAGAWLRFRGHLENISDNMLMGAVNAFNDKANEVWNALTGEYGAVSAVAKSYKKEGMDSIVVAEDNYGEGSSREHAAMEPRFLNVKVVLAKSFARIHETNLKKQGMLALTFENKDDYDKIQEKDILTVRGLSSFAPGSKFSVEVRHQDGSTDCFTAVHTYDEKQIAWYKAGSALNYLKKQEEKKEVNK